MRGCRVENMAEFEALKNRNAEARKAPVVKRTDNKYKQQLELIFLSMKLDVVREYKFHEKRHWKFDFALPAIRVAIEYEGLNFGHGGASGHQTIKGVVAGNEKYSEACIAGWCLVWVNAISVKNGLAHQLIQKAVNSRRVN